MIQAINKYLIVEKTEVENVSATGIITTSEPTKTVYKVIGTTEETKELQDKEVFIKNSHPIEKDTVAVHIDDIIAWK